MGKGYFVLLKILLVSVAGVTICCFLGPYAYKFESADGLLYYYGCLVLYAVPLCFCGKRNVAVASKRENKSKTLPFSLTVGGERIVRLAAIFAIIASVLFCVECIRLFSLDSILAGGDFRTEFGEERSSLSRYSEMIACLGPACFLIVAPCRTNNLVGTKLITQAALIAMGLTGLFLGARWKIFVCIMVLLFAIRFNGGTSEKFKGQIKVVFRWLVVAGLVIGILYAFFVLFAVRGNLSADEQWRFYPGDMPLTDSARKLYLATGGVVEPIYRAIDYIGQSPFVFSYLFVHYIPDSIYCGAFLFRILSYVLPLFGIPFPSFSRIVSETFTGMYSGSAYGLITDFGIIAAPIVFFLIGLCFAAIERHRRSSRLCSMLFPLICTMTICSPIYYLFHVGYADYILWGFFVLYAALSICKGWNIVSHWSSN